MAWIQSLAQKLPYGVRAEEKNYQKHCISSETWSRAKMLVPYYTFLGLRADSKDKSDSPNTTHGASYPPPPHPPLTHTHTHTHTHTYTHTHTHTPRMEQSRTLEAALPVEAKVAVLPWLRAAASESPAQISPPLTHILHPASGPSLQHSRSQRNKHLPCRRVTWVRPSS